MNSLAQFGTLALLACVFVYSLHRRWDGVYMVFGIVLLLGSCQMLGVK